MREKKSKASFILKVQDNMSDERGKRTRGIDRKDTRTGVKKRKKIVKRRNGGKPKTKKNEITSKSPTSGYIPPRGVIKEKYSGWWKGQKGG